VRPSVCLYPVRLSSSHVVLAPHRLALVHIVSPRPYPSSVPRKGVYACYFTLTYLSQVSACPRLYSFASSLCWSPKPCLHLLLFARASGLRSHQCIQENRTIHLSQRSYIDSILRRYGFEDLKPVSLPMEMSIRLTSAQSPSTTQEIAHMQNIPYQEAVGSLMYASLGTRPDITYAVQTVSHFSKNPGQLHWEAVKRIFRYLRGTKELWLTYGGQQNDLKGYADADGSMAEDRHTISGYAFLLHGRAVSWAAK
jgi:hypothetical protein